MLFTNKKITATITTDSARVHVRTHARTHARTHTHTHTNGKGKERKRDFIPVNFNSFLFFAGLSLSI